MIKIFAMFGSENGEMTRSIWLNCALRSDEAVYRVSIGQQWLVLNQYKAVPDAN